MIQNVNLCKLSLTGNTPLKRSLFQISKRATISFKAAQFFQVFEFKDYWAIRTDQTSTPAASFSGSCEFLRR